MSDDLRAETVGFTPDQVQAIYAYRDHVRGLGYKVEETTLLVIGFAAGLEHLAAHPVQDEGGAHVVNIYPIPEQTPAQVAAQIIAERKRWLR